MLYEALSKILNIEQNEYLKKLPGLDKGAPENIVALLLNVYEWVIIVERQWWIYPMYHGENKLHLNEIIMTMMSALY